MVILPAPFTLSVRRRRNGALDAHGNPTVAYEPGTPWPVHGYASGVNTEAETADRDLTSVLWTVYAPVGDLLPTAADLVTLGGADYSVVGDPRDYSHDPWRSGVGAAVVYLAKTEG